MKPGKPMLDIEIFPCAGGMGEGFRRAGVDFDMAIEIAEDHCDSYEANLHHRPFQMDARDFLKLARSGWRPGVQPIRMIVADPPCTPWSRAGKRMGESDPRDMLQVTCDLIAILRPLVYLIGNVPGLDDGPNLPITQRIIGGLSQYGYCTADFVRLDAANYGVPQHRVRPFWFGHLHGPCIQWPMPSHCDPAELKHPTLPGVERLLPWITCKDALGHLSMAELGRPIKLRKRNQNGAQHGSVEEAPARVVGTSNLSDGNVLLSSDAPRSKKGKRDRDRGRVAQGDRVGNFDRPAVTLTAKPSRKGAGAHAMFAMPEMSTITYNGENHIMSQADRPARTLTRNTHLDGAIILSHDVHHPPSKSNQPSNAIRAGSGGGATRAMAFSDKHRPPGVDEPSTTIRGGGEGHSAPHVVINLNAKHLPSSPDAPSSTIASKQYGNGSSVIAPKKSKKKDVISTSSNHPHSPHNAPAMTVRGSDGEGANRALEWPWSRPATTVLADERLPPPGHHDEDYAIMSTDGDGVVISELAAAILQGFPPTWKFVGSSKKKRWSQIGQAMPPPLAHAVACSVVGQIAKTESES